MGSQTSGLESANRLDPSNKLRLVVTMADAPKHFELLSPNSDLVVDQCEILFNPPAGTEADFWIVAANARPYDYMRCARENTMFIAWEPLEKKVYPKRYYRQFNSVVDTHDKSGHPRLKVDTTGLCWHVGLRQPENAFQYGYDFLSNLPFPEKHNKISVVCSSNRATPGQRLRLDFLDAVKRELGDSIVHFGRGFQPIGDKLDAILPYRFHLALENCQAENHWSEKIADPLLGWAFPIYVGCPNLSKFLPPQSFVRIDPANLELSLDTLKRSLESPATLDEQQAIAQGRDRILHHWNPFYVWARWARQMYQPLPKRKSVIWSHKAYRNQPMGLLFRSRAWSRALMRTTTP